jgi:pyruvate/2-oxoglutarate dehydrogenase complex dihydrolipoamide dehydrogenase (E3) component
MAKRFDAIVIGTGQAGPALATRLAAAGRSVCIVERASFGGTCVNNGCTPTKTMVASAYAARMARRAGEYGIDVGGAIKADMKRVKARKDEIVNRPRARSSAGCARRRASASCSARALHRPRTWPWATNRSKRTSSSSTWAAAR